MIWSVCNDNCFEFMVTSLGKNNASKLASLFEVSKILVKNDVGVVKLLDASFPAE